MSKWSEEQDVKNQKRVERQEKDKVSRETLGKYFYDLSKLSFTAMCLGGVASLILDYTAMSYWVLVICGIFVTIALARVGNNILKK